MVTEHIREHPAFGVPARTRVRPPTHSDAPQTFSQSPTKCHSPREKQSVCSTLAPSRPSRGNSRSLALSLSRSLALSLSRARARARLQQNTCSKMDRRHGLWHDQITIVYEAQTHHKNRRTRADYCSTRMR
jgi:hypothetical protein